MWKRVSLIFFFVGMSEGEINQNFHQPWVPQFVWDSLVFLRFYRFFHTKISKWSTVSPIIYSPLGDELGFEIIIFYAYTLIIICLGRDILLI
jgi:hypothetical protein